MSRPTSPDLVAGLSEFTAHLPTTQEDFLLADKNSASVRRPWVKTNVGTKASATIIRTRSLLVSSRGQCRVPCFFYSWDEESEADFKLNKKKENKMYLSYVFFFKKEEAKGFFLQPRAATWRC